MPPIMPINPMDPNALQLWNALLGITNPNMVPETTVLQPPGTEPSVPMDSSQYAQLAQAVNADLPNPGQTFNGDAIPQEPIDQKGYPSMEAALAAQNAGPTGEPPMTPELLAASISPEGTGQGMTEPSLPGTEQPESQGFQSGGLLQNLAMALAAAAPGLMFGARSAGAGGKSYSDELKRQDENRKLRMQQQQAEQKAILSAMTAMQGRNLRRELSQASIESREKEGALNRTALGERTEMAANRADSRQQKGFQNEVYMKSNFGPDAPAQTTLIDATNSMTSDGEGAGALKALPGMSIREVESVQKAKANQAKIDGENRRREQLKLQELGIQDKEAAAIKTEYRKKIGNTEDVARSIAQVWLLLDESTRLSDPAMRRALIKMQEDKGVMTDVEIGRSLPGSIAYEARRAWGYITDNPDAPITDSVKDQIKTYLSQRARNVIEMVAAAKQEASNLSWADASFMTKKGKALEYIASLGSSSLSRIPYPLLTPSEQSAVMFEIKEIGAPIYQSTMLGNSIVLPRSGRVATKVQGGWDVK